MSAPTQNNKTWRDCIWLLWLKAKKAEKRKKRKETELGHLVPTWKIQSISKYALSGSISDLAWIDDRFMDFAWTCNVVKWDSSTKYIIHLRISDLKTLRLQSLQLRFSGFRYHVFLPQARFILPGFIYSFMVFLDLALIFLWMRFKVTMKSNDEQLCWIKSEILRGFVFHLASKHLKSAGPWIEFGIIFNLSLVHLQFLICQFHLKLFMVLQLAWN